MLEMLLEELEYLIVIRNKTPIKDDGPNHPRGDKKGRPKKGQKTHSPKGPKRGSSPGKNSSSLSGANAQNCFIIQNPVQQ
jgi:hypothetical protein